MRRTSKSLHSLMKPLPPDSTLRLDRFLAHASEQSRSQVRKLLKAGAVTVDGVACADAERDINAQHRVTLDGAVLEWPRARYVMLHKPEGYVCSQEDANHPLVTSLLATPWAESLHSAGRLDVDTTGLVLLTNDGDWSHRVTSPRRRCNKTYLAGLKHPLADDVAQRFAAGLQLNGEAEATLPAQLQVLDPHTARVTLHEGRYHQVKRMFAACSNRVVTLHRERIGTIQLDPALAPGQWRELDHNEIRSFLHD
jgi:16S rRNA pseudouridine516 synthase